MPPQTVLRRDDDSARFLAHAVPLTPRKSGAPPATQPRPRQLTDLDGGFLSALIKAALGDVLHDAVRYQIPDRLVTLHSQSAGGR